MEKFIMEIVVESDNELTEEEKEYILMTFKWRLEGYHSEWDKNVKINNANIRIKNEE